MARSPGLLSDKPTEYKCNSLRALIKTNDAYIIKERKMNNRRYNHQNLPKTNTSRIGLVKTSTPKTPWEKRVT